MYRDTKLKDRYTKEVEWNKFRDDRIVTAFLLESLFDNPEDHFNDIKNAFTEERAVKLVSFVSRIPPDRQKDLRRVKILNDKFLSNSSKTE